MRAASAAFFLARKLVALAGVTSEAQHLEVRILPAAPPRHRDDVVDRQILFAPAVAALEVVPLHDAGACFPSDTGGFDQILSAGGRGQLAGPFLVVRVLVLDEVDDLQDSQSTDLVARYKSVRLKLIQH
jgi:hypothetical protein